MTLFEKIIAREIPADIVYEDDLVLAFNDINPKAPTHVLIIPKKPIPRIAEAEPEDHQVLGHLLLKAREIASELGLHEKVSVSFSTTALTPAKACHTCICTSSADGP